MLHRSFARNLCPPLLARALSRPAELSVDRGLQRVPTVLANAGRLVTDPHERVLRATAVAQQRVKRLERQLSDKSHPALDDLSVRLALLLDHLSTAAATVSGESDEGDWETAFSAERQLAQLLPLWEAWANASSDSPASPQEAAAATEALLRQHLVGQDEAVRGLSFLAARLQQQSHSLEGGTGRRRRRGWYLEGPEGSGRSLAASLVAQALRVPFASVPLQPATSATFILGDKDTHSAGILARACLQTGSPNTLVLVRSPETAPEEAQEALATLLDDLHSGEGYCWDEGLQAPVPTGTMTNILVSCGSTGGIQPPFSKTSGRVVFHGLSPLDKTHILVHHALPRALSDVGMDPHSVTLSEEQLQRLRVEVFSTDPGASSAVTMAEAIASAALVRHDPIDLDDVLSSDDVFPDFVRHRWTDIPWGVGMALSVSALDRGVGGVDVLEVARLPRALRGRRMLVTAMHGSARESADVALTAVTAMLDEPLDGPKDHHCHEEDAPEQLPGTKQRSSRGFAWEEHGGSLERFPWNSGGNDNVEDVDRVIQSTHMVRAIAGEESVGPASVGGWDWHVAFVEPSMRASDGASGGLCIALGILSVVLNQPLPRDLAITGALSLHGHVMQVGSVHEKASVLTQHGVKRFMLPETCRTEFERLPESVRRGVEPVFVASLRQAVSVVFGRPPSA
jgi:hypothetical protein